MSETNRNGLFITATDTGVGKTTVLCHLGRALQKAGYDIGVLKPLQTGLSKEKGDYHEYKKWMTVDSEGVVVPQKFDAPEAPSIAAKIENRHIRFDAINRSLYIMKRKHKNLLIEGAGGVLVPIGRGKTMLDLMVKINYPVLVVARTTLGTINHTLLTIEALRKRNLEIAGIVFNHAISNSGTNFESVFNEIQKLSKIRNMVEFAKIKTDGEFVAKKFLKFFRK